MLYTKDREALFEKYYDFLEDLQDEPAGDPADYLSILGSPVWGVYSDTYTIYYDERSTVEAVLVRENGVYYVIADGYNAFIDPAEEVPLTNEEAVAYRNKLIAEMSWEDLYESFKYDVKNHPKEWGALLDKIRPLYKEATASWAV